MDGSFKVEAPLNTAVLFLVFNRPDTTKQVFDSIRQAKPPRLYVAADGPRANRENEIDIVSQVRDIATDVDWPCDLKTLFQEKNLGCKRAVSSAINWFFEQEEQGIILEDDCLPSQSFYWYCETLLNRYKYDNRIFLISGYNKFNKWKKDENQYFFSNLGGIWGWASWRRCWNHYDVEMKDINEFIAINGFRNALGDKIGSIKEKQIYESIFIKNVDTWDYQWAYVRYKNNALACVPCSSLIENIGFGPDATHTIGINIDAVIRHEISFPISENVFIAPDREYDELFADILPIWRRILLKIKLLLKRLYVNS